MALLQIDHLKDEMAECTDNCFEAAQACEWCADECIQMGEADMGRCIQLCRDVADLTTMHARFMARESEFHRELAGVCADACEACADECSQFDAEHCQVCADVVRECAESCRKMASA